MRTEVTATTAVVSALRGCLGDRVSTALPRREAHASGESLTAAPPPDAVVFAQTTDDVVATVTLCHEHRVPVIPYGVGTSLEGQVHAVHGGVCLDLSAMTRILTVNPEDLDCRVEAGVTREQLNADIRAEGLFFPIDPGANATLGGMAATRASGTNAVRYGTMRDVTLGLTVVTPNGQVIQTGGRARKSSAGYDLTRLYIGSEGTLGVITELQLRLFGVPESTSAVSCQFSSLEDAVRAVTIVLQMGIPVARIELMDEVQMGASIAFSRLAGLAPLPTLLMEFHGSTCAVEDQMREVLAITQDLGGGEFRHARSTEERTALWAARHDAYWAARSLRPGFSSYATDACVPISHLPACIREAKADAEASKLVAPIVGHVGDGNFHMLILFDSTDPMEGARADALAQSVARRALNHGGTITGEHGIGLHKRTLMPEEHGEALAVMRAIKTALDPTGIMNPGILLPR